MNQPHIKLSLLAVAVSAALAACGGGGGDGGAAAPAAPTTTGTTTTATAPTTGATLTASTGTSSGAASNTTGTITPGLPAAPSVPTANLINETVAAASYAAGTQAARFYSIINSWRGDMRFEEENGGTRLGVGSLTQRAPQLDAAAAAVATGGTPDFTGFAVTFSASLDSANTIPLNSSDYCSKALLSSLPGAELAVSGMRFVGLSIPEINVGNCAMVVGLETAATWQLPPTGSSAVYPFPGKQLTLPRYFGNWAGLGFASQPGHAVHVSLASVDALPFAVPGAGTGQAIAPSAITINEFTLRLKSSNALVASTVFTQAGVVAGSGVTLTSTNQLLFPTSVVLVPNAPLTGETVYTATVRAVVNGRTVTRTWDFTTSN